MDYAGPVREKVSTSVDLPLSNTSKRVLAYAAEEAERLGHKHIGTGHLLLGLLRESNSVAATVLGQEGIKIEEVRRVASASALSEPSEIGAKAYAGRGVGFVSGSGRIAAVEFVCDGQVIASVLLFPGSPVPRQGEKILLRDKATESAFYVEEVSYVYDRFPPDMTVAPHTLARVVITIRREQEPTA